MLVAPQFAVNAADFERRPILRAGAFRRFVEEAARPPRAAQRRSRARAAFEALPVILVAYSGGYAPAAWAAHHGGIGDRLRGIVLFDALYAELDKFADWIERRESGILFQRLLALGPRREPGPAAAAGRARHRFRHRAALQAGDRAARPSSPTADEVGHGDFVTKAWVDDPLRTVLARIPGYPRTPPPKKRRAQ